MYCEMHYANQTDLTFFRSAAYENVYSTLALQHDMREPQYG